MKRFRVFVLLAILPALLCSLAQAADLKKEVLGKWKEVGKNEVMEFMPDGKFKVGEEKVFELKGTYTFSADDTVKITITHEGKTLDVEAKISLAGDILTFTPKGENPVKYQKVK